MLNYRYSVNWYVPRRIQEDFSVSEQECIERAVWDFNDYYEHADPKMVPNRKHISSAKAVHNRVVIRFETEKPLVDMRRGNALRQFSRFLSEEGFELYVENHRLMRA